MPGNVSINLAGIHITQFAEPHRNTLESENSNHLFTGIPMIIHKYSIIEPSKHPILTIE